MPAGRAGPSRRSKRGNMSQPIRQRLRITFAQSETIKYISHLDLVRTWERTLRRAAVPLAYSRGFSPRPKMTFAAALPVGVTGEREMMDVILERLVMPRTFARRLAPHLPPGIKVSAIKEVYLGLPALQTQVCAAQYRLQIAWAEGRAALQAHIDDLLAVETLVRERRGKTYDLRPLIEALWIGQDAPRGLFLHMHLSLGIAGTARHDEVLDALGLAETMRAACREKLIFEGTRHLPKTAFVCII